MMFRVLGVYDIFFVTMLGGDVLALRTTQTLAPSESCFVEMVAVEHSGEFLGPS